MSRAFVKESDDAVEDLPDRPIDDARNIVTASGLQQIESEIARLTQELAQARINDDRSAQAYLLRDLRYWTKRKETAELVHPPQAADKVTFGMVVSLEEEDGQQKNFRIVGIDEADPSKGLLSYLSPLARALIGKVVGDEVKLIGKTSGITAISSEPMSAE